LVDEARRVRSRRVINEDVDVRLRREQGADVPIEHEVGLDRSLDRLLDALVGDVGQVANLLAHLLLPLRKAGDVVIDTRITV
jgi:hypothetical protein